MTNANGHDPLATLREAMNEGQQQQQQVMVNQIVVTALRGLLEKAEKGEITALAVVAADAKNLTTADVLVVDNIAIGMMMQGALLAVNAKITQAVLESQKMTMQPVSRILRPPTGMNVPRA